MTKGFGDITAGLKNVAGADGANQLVDKIKNFTGSIDSLGLGNISEGGNSVLSSLINKFMDTVKSLLGSQNETIQGILQPALDSLMEKLKPFAN